MPDHTCWTCHHDDTRDVFCAVLDDESKRKRGTKRAIRAWLDEQPKHGRDGCRPGGPAKGYPPKLAARACPGWVAGRDHEGGDDA